MLRSLDCVYQAKHSMGQWFHRLKVGTDNLFQCNTTHFAALSAVPILAVVTTCLCLSHQEAPVENSDRERLQHKICFYVISKLRMVTALTKTFFRSSDFSFKGPPVFSLYPFQWLCCTETDYRNSICLLLPLCSDANWKWEHIRI